MTSRPQTHKGQMAALMAKPLTIAKDTGSRLNAKSFFPGGLRLIMNNSHENEHVLGEQSDKSGGNGLPTH